MDQPFRMHVGILDKRHLEYDGLCSLVQMVKLMFYGGQVLWKLWHNLSNINGPKMLPRSSCTHVKISQLVAGLQTSHQQVEFARLVPSCQQVWKMLLTT